MIEARGLAVGYGRRVVASHIDVTVGAGEVLCLLGPNGSGKTTLFKTLLGLIPPLAGEVLLNGVAIARQNRRDIARAIAYVPQAHAPVFAYSVLDLVLMGRTAHLGPFSSPGARDIEIAHAALQSLGIDTLAEADATRISGGQLQLALIARALAQDARMIVMDEPTASLDFGNQVRVLEQVRALAAGGIGVVMSTHDPDQAFLCADRVALFHRGTLLCADAPERAVTADHLRLVYGVEVRIETVADGAGGVRRVCVPRVADAR